MSTVFDNLESGNNLCLQSNALNVTWGNTNSTDSQNVGADPFGGNAANSINEDGSNAAHYVNQPVAMADNTIYTWSAYLKASNRTWGYLQTYGLPSSWNVFYNLATGATASAGGTPLIDYGMIDAGNGWYRCWATYTTGVGGARNVLIAPAAGNGQVSYQGTTQESILVAGAMLNEGSLANYMPTTTVPSIGARTYLDDLDSLNLNYITGSGVLSNPVPTMSGDGETERVSVDATLDAPVPVVVGVGERILWARGSPVPLFAPAATITGIGGLVRDGSGAVAGTLPTLTGTAERVLPGSGSAIGSVARAAGVGVILSAGIGTLDAPLPTVTGAGTKSEPRTGSGTPSVAAATIFGFGNTGDTIAGGGNQVNYPATFSGAGVILKSGSGTLDAGFPFVSAVGNVGVSQTNDGDTISAAASVDSAGYITRKISSALQSAPAVTTGTVIIEGTTSGAGASAPNSAFLSCLGLVITAPVGPVDFPTDHIAIVTPNASQFYTTAITGQVNQLENFATVGARMGGEVGVAIDLSGVISNPRYFLFELVCNDSTWAGGTGPLGGPVGIELTVLYNNELTRIASFTPAYESIYLLNYPSDRTRFYAVRDALTAGECTFYLGGYETVATRSYGLAFPDTGSLNVIIDQ